MAYFKKAEPFTVGTVEVVKASERAVLVRLADLDEIWVPFSQIDGDSGIHEQNCGMQTEGVLIISAWLAKQKDLINDESDESF